MSIVARVHYRVSVVGKLAHAFIAHLLLPLLLLPPHMCGVQGHATSGEIDRDGFCIVTVQVNSSAASCLTVQDSKIKRGCWWVAVLCALFVVGFSVELLARQPQVVLV